MPKNLVCTHFWGASIGDILRIQIWMTSLRWAGEILPCPACRPFPMESGLLRSLPLLTRADKVPENVSNIFWDGLTLKESSPVSVCGRNFSVLTYPLGQVTFPDAPAVWGRLSSDSGHDECHF